MPSFLAPYGALFDGAALFAIVALCFDDFLSIPPESRAILVEGITHDCVDLYVTVGTECFIGEAKDPDVLHWRMIAPYCPHVGSTCGETDRRRGEPPIEWNPCLRQRTLD